MNLVIGFTNMQIFNKAHLAELGATVEEFEADPIGTLDKFGQYDALTIIEKGNEPLNAKQVRIRQEWDATWEAEGSWKRPAVTAGRTPVAKGGVMRIAA